MQRRVIGDEKEIKPNKLTVDKRKKQDANNFIDHLLIKCKSHGGTVTIIPEIKKKLQATSQSLRNKIGKKPKRCLKPKLYKVDRLSWE